MSVEFCLGRRAAVALFLLSAILYFGGVDGQLDTHECNAVSFSCMDAQGVPRCIPNTWICDGYSDCYDNMDEANCYYTETNCTETNQVQCGAFRCLPQNSPLFCNGNVDCRGYNGTYVYAAYAVDESADYCSPGTTTTTTIFPSSMGWQPFRSVSWPNAVTQSRPFANVTKPPFTQISTTDAFWRSYCSRQVAINYCPRRCQLHGMCAPLRINPPRNELSKMVDELNPPVVGMVPRTRTSTTTTVKPTVSGATTPSVKQRLLNEELLQRLLMDEARERGYHTNDDDDRSPTGRRLPTQAPVPPPANPFRSGNTIDNNKKRRDSAVNPNLMADTNMIYDWTDDEASSAHSVNYFAKYTFLGLLAICKLLL